MFDQEQEVSNLLLRINDWADGATSPRPCPARFHHLETEPDSDYYEIPLVQLTRSISTRQLL